MANTTDGSGRRFRRFPLGAAGALVVASTLAVAGRSLVAQAQRPAQPVAQAQAAGVPELEAAVRAMAQDSTFKDAKVGVSIVDVDTGRVLAAHEPHLSLNPASNAKLYTAAAALAILRPEHRFETSLSGKISGDSLDGGLVLKGHGDPSLETSDLWEMVQELKSRGVRRVDGDILVDQRFFDESFTPPAFDQQPHEWAAFRANVSALAVNENTVTLAVRPTSAGQPASSAFDPPGFVDVDGAVKTSEPGADTVGLALAPAGKRLSAKLSGNIGEDAKLVRYTRRVDDPSLLGGYVLRALLEQANIKVTGDVQTGSLKTGAVLARHKSAPLAQLLFQLGKTSDNFYAEMIFKTIGGESKGRPAKSDGAAEVVSRWLEHVGASEAGVVIKNGSGLFDANRVTAASMAQLLRVAWRDPSIQPEFLAQLAVGGVDGTLHGRFHSERGRRAVRAKTGTLDDAIALSGYVLGPPGRGPVAFAIVFNSVAGKAYGARAAADKLVEMVAARQWSR